MSPRHASEVIGDGADGAVGVVVGRLVRDVPVDVEPVLAAVPGMSRVHGKALCTMAAVVGDVRGLCVWAC